MSERREASENVCYEYWDQARLDLRGADLKPGTQVTLFVHDLVYADLYRAVRVPASLLLPFAEQIAAKAAFSVQFKKDETTGEMSLYSIDFASEQEGLPEIDEIDEPAAADDDESEDGADVREVMEHVGGGIFLAAGVIEDSNTLFKASGRDER